jgi:hypothetical protein
MKKFLQTTASWSFLLFGILTILILCAEPPTGPADEPYIEHEMFVKTWGGIILGTWIGLIVTAVTCGSILRFKYEDD